MFLSLCSVISDGAFALNLDTNKVKHPKRMAKLKMTESAKITPAVIGVNRSTLVLIHVLSAECIITRWYRKYPTHPETLLEY